MIEWKAADRIDCFGLLTFRATVAGFFDIRLVNDDRQRYWTVEINGRKLKGRPADLDGAKQLAASALARRCRMALDELTGTP